MKRCVFIPGLSLVAGVFLLSAAAMPVQAGAEVHVRGSFGEEVGKNGDNSGAEDASSSVTDESDYSDTYTATASATGTTLKAKALAYFASGTGIGAVSSARSTWTDTLTLMNPELIQPFAAGTVFLYFAPVAAGQGRYGEAVLQASLKPAGGQEIAGEKRVVFGAGSIGGRCGWPCRWILTSFPLPAAWILKWNCGRRRTTPCPWDTAPVWTSRAPRHFLRFLWGMPPASRFPRCRD